MADEIADATLRRELELQRFATFLVKNEVDETIQDISEQIPALLNALGDSQDLTITDKKKVSSSVVALAAFLFTAMWERITEQLEELAVIEADNTAALYSETLDVNLIIPRAITTIKHVTNAIMTLVAGKKKAVSGIWSKFTFGNKESAIKLINGAIWSGYSDNLSNEEILRRIRGRFNRSTKKYQGGILHGLPNAQAETLIRAGVNHFSNQARDRMASANKYLIKSRILIAKIDDRTTDICRRRNLKEWDINDDTYPRLPFHWGERSVFRFIFKKESESVLNTIDEARKETTNEFLKRQPKSFIVDTLGRRGADLLLSGKISIERLIDAARRPITIDDLK